MAVEELACLLNSLFDLKRIAEVAETNFENFPFSMPRAKLLRYMVKLDLIVVHEEDSVAFSKEQAA